MRRVLAVALLLLPLVSRTANAQVNVPNCVPGTGFVSPLPITAGPAVPPMVPPTPPNLPAIPRGEPPSPAPFEDFFRNPFAQAAEAGGQPSRTFNENFDGDFGGVFYKRVVTVRFNTVPRVVGFTQRVTGFTPVTTQTVTQVVTTDNTGRAIVTNTITNTTTNNPIIVNDPVVVQDQIARQRVVRLPLAARYSGILITDNDNPRPQDRVYAGFNFYDNIGSSLNPGLGPVDLQRQMAGFEKTFLNGDASFGMRLPFVQIYGPAGVGGTHDVGDLSLIWKYAWWNDRETGDLISSGLVLTTPTGSGNAILFDGSKAPHSLLFQPWAGFVRTADRAYLQGVTSLIVPTDSRDPTLWNNSLGVGYYLYRAPAQSLLSAVVPTAEVHVRTPLSGRNPCGVAYLQDQVNVTGGVHFRFSRAVLSAAACVPVVGPRPWSLEAMSFFNLYF